MVVRTCDVLRTVIGGGASGSNPIEATVLAAPPLRTEVIDLDHADVEGWCASRIAQPIDAHSCCYDSVLLRHADDDWTWWLDLHHLVTDATSQTLVHRLTSLAYAGEELERGVVRRLRRRTGRREQRRHLPCRSLGAVSAAAAAVRRAWSRDHRPARGAPSSSMPSIAPNSRGSLQPPIRRSRPI